MKLLFQCFSYSTAIMAFRERKRGKQSQTFHFRHNMFSEMADESVL